MASAGSVRVRGASLPGCPPSRRSVRRAGSLSGTRFDPVRPPSGSVRGVASGWSGFWSGSGRGPRPASGSGPAPSGAVRLRPAPSGTRSAVRRPVRHRSSGVHASVGPPSGPVRREISPSGGLRRAPRPAASAGRQVVVGDGRGPRGAILSAAKAQLRASSQPLSSHSAELVRSEGAPAVLTWCSYPLQMKEGRRYGCPPGG